MSKTKEQKRARSLQKDTGWSYSECLRVVRSMTEDEINELVDERSKVPKTENAVEQRRMT